MTQGEIATFTWIAGGIAHVPRSWEDAGGTLQTAQCLCHPARRRLASTPCLLRNCLPLPPPMWHTLSCVDPRAADLQLRAPAVSVARRPAQLLGLLVLREGRGGPADGQACDGTPLR